MNAKSTPATVSLETRRRGRFEIEIQARPQLLRQGSIIHETGERRGRVKQTSGVETDFDF
jgi:hypothetical protein